ncbi:hypothetical protein [Chitinophaga sp. CB10]|nr:hypothetical protein [Chitinophaga sp. CB10]
MKAYLFVLKLQQEGAGGNWAGRYKMQKADADGARFRKYFEA